MKNGLYKLRKAKKLTLLQVAKMMDCSSTLVCQWEHNQRTPSIDVLKKYAKVLGVTVNKLVDAYDETI